MKLIDADTLYYENVDCTDGNSYMVVNASQIINTPAAFNLEYAARLIDNIKTDNSCADCRYKDKCNELRKFYNPAEEINMCALVTKQLALDIIKSVTNSSHLEGEECSNE